jgi:hypothetical protein
MSGYGDLGGCIEDLVVSVVETRLDQIVLRLLSKVRWVTLPALQVVIVSIVGWKL